MKLFSHEAVTPCQANSRLLIPLCRPAAPLPRRRYALPQQAVLTILLLLFNGQLCHQNVVVQMAYTTLQTNLAHRAQLLLGPLLSLQSLQNLSHYYNAGRSCSAAVLAAPQGAREAVRQACIAAAGPPPAPAAAVNAAAGAAAAAAAGSPKAAAALGAELCLRYQPARWVQAAAVR